MTQKPVPKIGEIPGVNEGCLYSDRYALYRAGVHRHNQQGIVGTSSIGAESIVLSGGYADDTDDWHEIVYTGEGGNDPKRRVQYADQQLTRGNLALAVSAQSKLPVRVVRGSRHLSPYSPVAGYRYDGLYLVHEYWSERTVAGFLIWRFRMRKLNNNPPPLRATHRRSHVQTRITPPQEQPLLFTYALDVLPTCPHCAAATRVHARFCPQCGERLGQATFALMAEQTLRQGEYTIARPLSHGGMGAIYLAHDHRAFGRLVVIKAMLDYYDTNRPNATEAAEERFLNEARTLAQLRHPVIPVILSYFQDSGRNYIVMEYIEGLNLAQQLSRWIGNQQFAGHQYPLATVRRWAIVLCEVLEYLASRQPAVIHHDIKPANLILDARDTIRLVDFGTARTRHTLPAAAVGVQQSSIFGTQGYAPPEQYRGQSEPRSDVYALAATLYHLATDDDPGLHPFQFPKLTDLGSFGRILQRALSTEVKERPTAAQLQLELVRIDEE